MLRTLEKTKSIQKTIDQISRDTGTDSDVVRTGLNEFISFLEANNFNRCEEDSPREEAKSPECPRLSTAYLHFTYRCNLRCVYCYNHSTRESTSSNGQELSMLEWLDIIDELASAGVKKLIFTGGEPLLRLNDVVTVAKHCQKYNIQCTLLTNGTQITNSTVDSITDVFSDIQISLDSQDKEINNSLRGKGNFELVTDAIQLLLAKDVNLTVTAVITKLNVGTMPEFVRWCRDELKVNVMTNFMMPDYFVEPTQEIEALIPDVEEFIKQRYEVFKAADISERKEYGKKVVVSPRFHCGAAFGQISLDPFGGVYPCQGLMDENFLAGNIQQSNIDELYQGSPILQALRNIRVEKIDKCSACEFRYICAGGCRAYSASKSNDFNLNSFPGESFCKMNKEMAKQLMETTLLLKEHCLPDGKETFVVLRPIDL